jgi:glycosyltransferase involved in cell wall biosynthesis
LASKNLEDCDIFHYWRSHGIKSARKAKEGGAKIFVENASSHPSVQNRILIEEYNKYGIISKPYVDDQLRKAIDELNYADYVVVPKGFAYDSFISEGFDRKKLIAVNFGIDLEKFKDFRKNKKDNKFRAIFVGQVTLRKGIQYLLEAWDKLDLENSELLVVGKLCADSESIVKKYKFNDSIKFLGQTNPMPYYAKSDIFVFPSIEEGSALVTYEAMACGLPQITTFNSGSVVRDGKDGFIIPIRDVKSIKEKINFFYKNPELMKKMSKNAREEVKKYPWSNYGATVLKAYKKGICVE